MVGIILMMAVSVYSQEASKAVVGKYDINQWFEKTGMDMANVDKYVPNDSVISLLKPIVKEQGINFIIIAGSWCKDCKSELPKIVSILNELGIDKSKVPVYGLDKDFYDPSFIAKKKLIRKVPTLIVTYQNEEMSRIEEFPKKGSTWELDILKMFQ